MKICIDARSPGRAGILTYSRCLLQGLSALPCEHEFIVLTAPGDQPWNLPGIREIRIPSRNPAHWMVWSNTALPRLLAREGVSVYHSLKHITNLRGDFKKVVTFHSARFLIYPKHYKWYDYAYWRTMCPLAARSYDAVITVSDAERKHYSGGFGIPASRFHSIHLACDERFGPVTDEPSLAKVRKQYALPEKFILYVGRINPVKNLETLVHAFGLSCREDGIAQDLVIVGHESWHSPVVRDAVEKAGVADRVHFTGPVFDELPAVYSLADLFVFPSYYEAFPAVPLEAMACGAPVLCSRAGGLPEGVGKAAVMVAPTDAAGFRAKLTELARSPELRKELRRKGFERVKRFSWEYTARQTVALYEEVLRR